MIAFVVVAALLLAGALLFVLPPLLSARSGAVVEDSTRASAEVLREHLRELDAEFAAGAMSADEHRAARDDLERRVLEDARIPAGAGPRDAAQARSIATGRGSGRSTWTAAALSITLPAVAVAVYATVGAPNAVFTEGAQTARGGQQVLNREAILAMVANLDRRLAAAPGDLEGWIMLARSRTVLGEFGLAAQAWARAAALRPGDAQLLADYADTLAMANGRRLSGEPRSLVEQALAVDPRHPKALALAGSAAFEAQDYPRAIALWERLLIVAGEGSDLARSVHNNIADARRRMTSVARNGVATARVTGTVRIDAALEQRARPEDTVFVFARAAKGPKLPLAIVRVRVADLPYAFSLDESMSMNPAMPLSSVDTLVVVARVSRSGAAAPSQGDLEGRSAPVRLGAEATEVRIDRVL